MACSKTTPLSARDMRPFYVGGFLLLVVALLWWNRKKRAELDAESERVDLRCDRGLCIGITVHGEHASRTAPALREVAQPVQELGLVGVRREAADRADLAAHVV